MTPVARSPALFTEQALVSVLSVEAGVVPRFGVLSGEAVRVFIPGGWG